MIPVRLRRNHGSDRGSRFFDGPIPQRLASVCVDAGSLWIVKRIDLLYVGGLMDDSNCSRSRAEGSEGFDGEK